MSTLYDILSGLCADRGITGYRMCKDLGIQPSIMTDLKMGRRASVKAETANKIANYFDVSVDYLLTGEQKETAPAEAEADNEMAELLETIRRRPDLRILFSLSKKATPEDVKKTIQIIKTICGDDDGADNC